MTDNQLNKIMQTLLDHPIITGIAILFIIGAIWLYFELKNAPNHDDWD